MRRLQIDILRISETRWANSGSCHHNETTFYYSGAEESDVSHGMEFLIKDSLKKYVKNIMTYSDKIIILQLAETHKYESRSMFLDKQTSRIMTLSNSMSNCAMYYEQSRKTKLT